MTRVSIWTHLNRQVFLGDDAFVNRMQALMEDVDEVNVSRAQRRPPPPSLEAIAAKQRDRDAAMVAAHGTGEYSYQQIADPYSAWQRGSNENMNGLIRQRVEGHRGSTEGRGSGLA